MLGQSYGGDSRLFDRSPSWVDPEAPATQLGESPAPDAVIGVARHPALICQGTCGQVHDRCLGRPHGVCTLPQGHPRPHKCGRCNQLYM